jgi:DNA invertase Pin-like site-specific DNA recombinase
MVSEHDPSPSRAYSYLRFSTPEQMGGDSLRRQTSLAADYAARHGLVLDEQLTYKDLGISAFRGINEELGRLGEFREAVRVGEVPKGSFLLVESLDRISRDFAFDAQRLLQNMIADGITVVTLLDERVYSLAGLRADPMGMMYSIMGFMRSNEESAVKSRRLKQVWGNKRAMIAERPLTSRAPAWLRLLPDRSGFELLPERADLVRRIFSMTLSGIGQHKIAETFNKEGIAPWGRGAHWHRSYIAKILVSRAVVGAFSPHFVEHEKVVGEPSRKRRQPTDEIAGYFPSVIGAEEFADVQALLAAPGKPKGRQAAAGISNILATIAACPLCTGTMTRVQKGKKSTPAFVCARAKAGAGCSYKSVPYEPIESRLLRALPEMVSVRTGLEPSEGLEADVEDAERRMNGLREQVETLVDSLLSASSPALRARLLSKEAELSEAHLELKALQGRRDAASGKVVSSRIDALLAALEHEDADSLDRTSINLAIRRLFKRAVINWADGRIDLEWIAGGVCEVYYWTAPKASGSA